MTVDVSALIAIIGVVLSIGGAIVATKNESKSDGADMGATRQILLDVKTKVEEIWADKKATEKEVAQLSQTVAVQARDMKTVFNKIDDLQEIADTNMRDIEELRIDVQLLNARLCKEGKHYDEQQQ